MVFSFARFMFPVFFVLPDQVLAAVVNDQAGGAVILALQPLPHQLLAHRYREPGPL